MKTTIRVGTPEQVKGTTLIVTVGVTRRVPDSVKRLDRLSGGAIGRLLRSGDFTGKCGQVATLHPVKGPRRLVLVGLGEKKEISGSVLRRAAAAGCKVVTAAGTGRLSVFVPPEFRGDVAADEVARVVTEGAGQGAWRFREYKGNDSDAVELSALSILARPAERRTMQEGAKRGEAVAEGQSFARNLQALPGNVCTPSYLGDVASDVAKEYGFKATVMDPARIKRNGMRALLAVARGSDHESRFIVLEYRGAKNGGPICLVGKGITFDTGGISLKPALNMEQMKYDMSGAAAVLGTFVAIGRLKPKCNVVGIIPAAENMPSGTATKPGDIVESHLGKTIEIVNTDAEGRLVLCDALSYARRFKPSCVLDAATLTGAVVIALGYHATAVLGNDDDLVNEVISAGDLAGERCWQLPLWDEYSEQIKSDVADIKNVGGRSAGTITAACFLAEFAEDYPWAHLDIAGTAQVESDAPHLAKGPAGTGVRLFTQFVLGRAAG